MKIDRWLTIILVLVAISAIGLVLFQEYQSSVSYDGNVRYSIKRVLASYDYSCNTPVYGIYVAVSNAGSMPMGQMSVEVSNPICEGAVPPIQGDLLPSQQMNFTVYSVQPNGTIVLDGNITSIQIRF